MLPLQFRKSIFVSFLALLGLFTTSNGQAFTLFERICCCRNITNACCAVDIFDIQSTQKLETGNETDFIRTQFYGNFTRAYADEDYIKNNLNIFAPEPVNCSETFALLLPTGDGLIVPLGQIVLDQISPQVCLMNFTSKVEATRLRETVDLALGFRDGFVPSGNDITVDLILRESIVGFSLPQHSFVATADPNDGTRLDLTFSVQVGQNSIHNTSCYEEPNLDQLAFQMGDPLDPAYPKADCLFPATSLARSLSRPTYRVDTLGIAQADYLNNCYDSVEVTEDFVIFTFQVAPAFGTSCEYIEDFPEYYDPYVFTVSISSTIMANNDGSTLANTVQVDYLDNTLELLPCSVDDEGFNRDVSELIPMGRLRFDVDVKTAYQFVPIDVTLPELKIQDIELEILSGPTFSNVNGTDVSKFTVQTRECLWVVTQHSEQPATQENLIGCTIDYLSQMTIVANVTFADSFIQDNELIGQERTIRYQSNNATDCPVQAITTDVTTTYNADLILQDVNGQTDNLNLDSPVIIRLGLDPNLMQAFDGLNVVMEQLIVTLTSEELTAVDGEFVRMFSPSDKRSQMQFDFHPYYEDGHFCRSYLAPSGNDTIGTCQRFYSEGTLGNWNPFLADSLSTDFFVEDLDGQPRFSLCQDRTDLKEDRFIFTPNNWVFSQFPYASGTMSITATAFVRSCLVVGDNGELTRRRALQSIINSRNLQENNDGSGSTIIFQNVSFINSNVVVNNGDGNTINSDSTIIRDIVIAFSTVIAILLCLVISLGIYFCRRYRVRVAQS